jgi:hypothetical protein
VIKVEKETCKYSSTPIHKGIENILAKDWNMTLSGQACMVEIFLEIKQCRKLWAWTRHIFEQMKAFLLEQLEEDGGSE